MRKLSTMLSIAGKFTRRHSPEILTGIGVAGMFTAIGLAIAEAPKAVTLLNEAREKKEDQPLTSVEKVKATWKCYIPAGTVAIASAACLIGASTVNHRRNAALAAAYTLSESTLAAYKNKVLETFGEKKEQTVRQAVSADKVKNDPVSSKEIIITEKGNTLCYDAMSGRYFRSDIEALRRIENKLNRRMRSEEYITLNDLYDELELPHVKLGDDLGWNMSRGYIDLAFSSTLADDGTPCLVLDYAIAPQYDYTQY